MVILFVYPILGVLLWWRFRHQPFSNTKLFLPLGAFVWGDVGIFSLFWLISSTLLFISGYFNYFPELILIFWLIRSLGEVQYWFHEQFTPEKRNKPQDLDFHQFFPGESIYFAYHIFWQCIAVVTILCLSIRLFS